MLSYLPFKPIKGQAFTLYFDKHSIEGYVNRYGAAEYNISSASFTWGVAKDGGTSTTPTNAVSNKSGNSASLLLTATEMNCDVLVLSGTYSFDNGSGSGIGGGVVTVIIYTQSAELSAVPTLNSSLSDKITAMYQYFFGKRTVTASAETLYKDNGTDALGTSTISDNGTTVSKGKIV